MNSLELKHITKTYAKTTALKDVNFFFEPGIYGLIGPNGAGKSTLLKMIATIHRADKGQVLFNEEDIFKLNKTYREKLGYMPQHQDLSLRLSVRAFLNYIASLKGLTGKDGREQVFRVMESFNLSRVGDKRISDLSGGYRQRVLLAQAFLVPPEILILDEPTVGLDPSERKNLRSLIGEQSAEAIVIIATHMMSDLQRLAEKILFIKQGELIQYGTQAELIEQTMVYTAKMTPHDIRKIDPDLIILDSLVTSAGPYTRFLSHVEDPSWQRVQATLDDVYVEWFEHV